MRKSSDIPFEFRKGQNDFGMQLYYVYNDLLKSIDPIHYGSVFEAFTSFYLIGFLRNLKEEITVLDIGANIGYYTCLINKLCPSSTIYSFEPHPVVFEALSMNVRGKDNIFPFQCGIGPIAGEFDLCVDIYGMGGGTFDKSNVEASLSYNLKDDDFYVVKSKIRNIDSFGIDFKKVKIVKIDVQGMEKTILDDIWDKVGPDTLFIVEEFNNYDGRVYGNEWNICTPEENNIIMIKK